MSADWTSWLARWSDAGLIDPETARRIREFEQEHARAGRLRWPILVVLAFGALMIGGGILLFVAAHWDTLSPARRFSLVLLLVGGFHVAAAFVADRFPAMGAALHAVGTGALGAGIALSGQIFHLEEHWPGGIMLWALGAAVAWAVLRQTPQMALTALLLPAWLTSEWIVAADGHAGRVVGQIPAAGVLLLALAYFTATGPGRVSRARRTLMWIGGLAFAPAAIAAALVASEDIFRYAGSPRRLSTLTIAVGWAAAIGGPLAIAAWLRRADAWPNGAAAVWVVALFFLRRFGVIALYPWWVLGAIGLVAWGLRDARAERINMGLAVFAATVGAFYFSHVMDRLGRSASLVGFGLLFLAGGWALERVRRRLVQQTRGAV